jgi:hypothetical protein
LNTEPQSQHRSRFSAAGRSKEDGSIEIIAISAGSGNGWDFNPEVLQASLSLWNGVESYIDHTWQARSVRDLAGICSNPRWEETQQGIRLTLAPLGPSADVLRQTAQETLRPDAPAPHIGFSADLIFSAAGKSVTRIEKVLSVDLVVNPARGGSFIPEVMEPAQKTADPTHQSLQEEGTIMNQTSEKNAAAVEEKAAVSDKSVQLCASLLDASLAAAHLPAAAEKNLRERFTSKVFEPETLQQAIRETGDLVSDLSGGAAIQGAGRISEMAAPEDQVNAALHDLLGAGRPQGLAKLQTARLSGIRELYLMMTGDTGFSGGYHRERAQFAASSDLPGLLKNAMNKLIIDQWQELGRSGYRWWEPVVQVEHFNSLQEITGVLVGEVTVLPSVAEGQPYTELPVKDSAETGAWGKYGGYVGLTLEMFERDETHKLRQYPRKLASAALRRISALVGNIFTANSGIGPLMADTYNVFEAAHHANLGTSALSSQSWEAAGKAIYGQPMAVGSGGTAPKLALDARYLIVPRDLRLTAMNLLYPSFAHESSIFSENMQKGQMGDVITCPEFSDAADWAAIADPRLAPGIILGERFGVLPEIIIADGETNGALFTNDEMRMKVRHWVSVFVADYRPLYKANVA